MRLGLRRLERVGAGVGVAVVGRHRAVVDEVAAPAAIAASQPVVVAGVDPGRLGQPVDVGVPARAEPARDSGRAGRWGSPAAARSGRRASDGARRGRRRGRRWWRAPRCRSARTGLAAGTPATRAGRRSGRRWRRRWRRWGGRSRRRCRRAGRRARTGPGCPGRRSSAHTGSGRPGGMLLSRGLAGRRPDRPDRRRGRAAGGHVVVGRDQQRGRVGERDVVGQPLRRHVAVRGDDRQALHPLVKLLPVAGHRARGAAADRDAGRVQKWGT